MTKSEARQRLDEATVDYWYPGRPVIQFSDVQTILAELDAAQLNTARLAKLEHRIKVMGSILIFGDTDSIWLGSISAKPVIEKTLTEFIDAMPEPKGTAENA